MTITDPKVKDLAKLFDNDLDLVQFFQKWLLNGKNATKAYQELHPDTDYGSAAVMASRMLKKVNMELVLASYGLGIEKWMQQLSDGLCAERSDSTGQVFPDHKTREPYHDKLGKLLGIETGTTNAIQVNFNQVLSNERKEFSL